MMLLTAMQQWWQKKAWQYIYPTRMRVNNTFEFGTDCVMSLDDSASSITIGNNVKARNRLRLYSGRNGHLFIDDNVFLNNGCSINCMASIRIGKNTQIGEDVKMYDHNHAYKNQQTLVNEQGYHVEPIEIGSNCWIGSNVVILKGVTIGNNVVVGAGCIIHTSIPDNQLVYHSQNLVRKSI